MRSKSLIIPSLGGAVGFLIILLAYSILLGVALSNLTIFSTPRLAGWQAAVAFGVAPVVFVLGAALAAKTLGASLWRSIAAGTAALVIFASLDFNQSSYAPFNHGETRAFIAAALVMVAVSRAGKYSFGLTAWLAIIVVALVLVGLRLLLPSGSQGAGLLFALLAWLLLPFTASLVSNPQGKGNTG